jgi:SAM-dependent methyltransferase
MAGGQGSLTSAMKNTPAHDDYNAELLGLIPADASSIVEVGCSSGALAREFLKIQPSCEYIGIELDPEYAELARKHCARVLVGNIEQMEEPLFTGLSHAECWIFGDVLEHLYDPWSVLQRVRHALPANGSLIACIPNVQHWSVQANLNLGNFNYADIGLMDRTHIRWFTKKTMDQLFQSAGFSIVDSVARYEGPGKERPQKIALDAIRAMAKSMGANPDVAATEAAPLQWVIRAVPA